MKVQVEDISAIQKKLTVELPADDVTQRLEHEYKQLVKTATVRGFRRGKAPKGLIRKMYRQDVEQRVSGNLIQTNLMAAFTQADITPLSVPDIERDPIAEGKPFTFSLFCQVRPAFTLAGVAGITVERKSVEPADDAIQAEIERLRMEHAELEPVEDRGADLGDTVTIDFAGRIEGETEPFDGGTGTEHPVELGTGSLIPGFEDQLVGSKPGDELKVELAFPEDYAEHLAGKNAVFDVSVGGVHMKVLPDVDDAFAEDCGHEDLSALKGSIYDQLAGELRDEEDGRVREAVIGQLLEANPVEVPAVLIEEAAERLKRQLGMQLSMSGMQGEMLQNIMEGQAAMIHERAKELALRDLLLDQLAVEKSIAVSDSELDERVGEIAERSGQPRPKVMATLRQGDHLEGLRVEMLHEKAVKWLEDVASGLIKDEPAAAADTSAEGEAETPAEENVEEDSTEAPAEGQDNGAETDETAEETAE